MIIKPDLTQDEYQEIKEQLSTVENHGQAGYIPWLKAAFYTHKSQIKRLLSDLDELRGLFLNRLGTSPISVKEAQLLWVCRICPKEAKCGTGESLVLNFGEEYAHRQCLQHLP